MELNKVLTKVQKLVAQAEHPNTDPVEAEKYRAMADKLMLEYAIEEATLEAARPAEQRRTPTHADFPTARDYDFASKVLTMLHSVAKHCRCVARFLKYDNQEHTWVYRVYGYESDLRYFEVMYVTLRLHMLGAFYPKWDSSVSDGENYYRMHNAGYGWREVANLLKQEYDEMVPIYVREYWKFCKAKGEKPTTIRRSSTYRVDAAQGYVTRIGQRLRKIETGRSEIGTALVLRSDDLEQWVREQSPDKYTRCPACGKLSDNPYICDQCYHKIAEAPETPECEACKRAKSGHCRSHKPLRGRYRNLNEAGYQAGVAHANTADLGGNSVSHNKTAIGN